MMEAKKLIILAWAADLALSFFSTFSFVTSSTSAICGQVIQVACLVSSHGFHRYMNHLDLQPSSRNTQYSPLERR